MDLKFQLAPAPTSLLFLHCLLSAKFLGPKDKLDKGFKILGRSTAV